MSEKKYKYNAYQDVYYFFLNGECINTIRSDVYIDTAPKGKLVFSGYTFESLWNFIAKIKYGYTADACCYRTWLRNKRVIRFFDQGHFDIVLRENPNQFHGCRKLHSWRMSRWTEEVELKVHNSSDLGLDALYRYVSERTEDNDSLEG